MSTRNPGIAFSVHLSPDSATIWALQKEYNPISDAVPSQTVQHFSAPRVQTHECRFPSGISEILSRIPPCFVTS